MPLLTQKTFSSSTFHHLLIPNKVKTAWPSSQDKAAENLHLCLHLCAYQLSFWMISNSLVSSCQSRSSVCTGFDIQFQQLQIFCIYLVLFLLLKAIDNFLTAHCLNWLWRWKLCFISEVSFRSSVILHRLVNAFSTGIWELGILAFARPLYFKGMLYEAEKHTNITAVPYRLTMYAPQNVFKAFSPKT